MPESYQGEFITLYPWAARWNLSVHALIANREQVLTEATNIEYGYDGTLRKRGGVSKFNQTPLIDTEL